MPKADYKAEIGGSLRFLLYLAMKRLARPQDKEGGLLCGLRYQRLGRDQRSYHARADQLMESRPRHLNPHCDLSVHLRKDPREMRSVQRLAIMPNSAFSAAAMECFCLNGNTH